MKRIFRYITGISLATFSLACSPEAPFTDDGNSDQGPGGSEEEKEYIEISSADDLMQFAADVNQMNGMESEDVVLTCDIDMSGIKDWTPIGNGIFLGVTSGTEHNSTYEGAAFKGNFDGRGHAILNLDLTSEIPAPQSENGNASTPYGLFGILDGAKVSNLVMGTDNGENSSLSVTAAGAADAGVIAGVCYGSIIENCKNFMPIDCRGSLTDSKRFTAAMVGFLSSGADGATCSVLKNLENNGAVTAVPGANTQNGGTSVQVAGICGLSDTWTAAINKNEISGCVNNGDIMSQVPRSAGIAAAINMNTVLSGCVNNGDHVNNSEGARAANITCILGSKAEMYDCINKGDLTVPHSQAQGGGLVCLLNHETVLLMGGGNYGTVICNNESGYHGLLAANWSKFSSASNMEAGGSFGLWSESGEHDMVELTEANYMDYIGKYNASDISRMRNITLGGDEPGQGGNPEAELKILFIGNSFTRDAVEHLPGMLDAAGLDKVKLVHMYYGGRTVPEYYSGFETKNDYTCYMSFPGSGFWVESKGRTIEYMAASDTWDIVTIQEHTGNSAAWLWTADEKDALQGLIDKVVSTQGENSPVFYYIMSQAYFDMDKIAQSQRPMMTFSTQDEMYDVIVSQAQKVMSEVSFNGGLIPTGTVLQNLRTSYLDTEMNLTRDGYHMDYGIARYAASCAVFETLISPNFGGLLLDGNTYRYDVTDETEGSWTTPVTDFSAPIALMAARYALETPYQVTDMSDVQEPKPGNGIDDIEVEEGNKE